MIRKLLLPGIMAVAMLAFSPSAALAQHREHHEHHGRARVTFGFGYYPAPRYYGGYYAPRRYYYNTNPYAFCNPAGFYDQWGVFHYYPGCY